LAGVDFDIAGMAIMLRPPHVMAIGMPACIMVIMRLQASMNISADMPSMGITRQVMPSPVISQVMRHIIGIIIMPGIIAIGMPAIIGFIMPGIIGLIMPGIMPPVIGMPAIIGIGIIPVIIIDLLRARLDRCSAGSGGETHGLRRHMPVRRLAQALVARRCVFPLMHWMNRRQMRQRGNLSETGPRSSATPQWQFRSREQRCGALWRATTC
jgi:hypothetical protein